MISWWWLIPAFYAGVACGFVVLALVSAGKVSDD